MSTYRGLMPVLNSVLINSVLKVKVLIGAFNRRDCEIFLKLRLKLWCNATVYNLDKDISVWSPARVSPSHGRLARNKEDHPSTEHQPPQPREPHMSALELEVNSVQQMILS